MSILRTTSGSLSVCLVTKSAVYLSADTGRRTAPTNAAIRKLVPFGTSALCAVSGLIRFTRTDFDAGRIAVANETMIDLAEIIENIPPPENKDSGQGEVIAFANALHDVLKPTWSWFARDLDEPFNGPGCLTDVLYANRGQSERVIIASTRIRYRCAQAVTGNFECLIEAPRVQTLFDGIPSSTSLFACGRTQCFNPTVLDGDMSDHGALDALNEIFRNAIRNPKCAAVIGEQVDVAVTGPTGRRWLQLGIHTAEQIGTAMEF